MSIPPPSSSSSPPSSPLPPTPHFILPAHRWYYPNDCSLSTMLSSVFSSLNRPTNELNSFLSKLSAHWISHVGDLRVLLQENLLREIGLPLRFIMILEEQLMRTESNTNGHVSREEKGSDETLKISLVPTPALVGPPQIFPLMPLVEISPPVSSHGNSLSLSNSNNNVKGKGGMIRGNNSSISLSGDALPIETNDGDGNGNGLLFQYGGKDFGVDGIIHYLATSGLTKPWSNPSQMGVISVYSSSLLSDSVPLHAVVGNTVVRCVTKSEPLSWMCIDFLRHSVRPSHYTLRHYSSWDNESLRHWRLEGSNDGRTWELLMEHQNDDKLNKKGATHTWSIPQDSIAMLKDENSKGWRLFRILQTAENSNKHHYLACSGWEMHGVLFEGDPAKPLDHSVANLLSSQSDVGMRAQGIPNGGEGLGLMMSPSLSLSSQEIVCSYVSDLDGNGILNYLATSGRTTTWVNPALAGHIGLTASTLADDSQPVHAAVGNSVVRCVTKSEPNSWFQVDFLSRSVCPSHYMLRHYSSWDSEALRNWRFLASNDQIEWTVLMEHKNDESLRLKGQTFTWSIPPQAVRDRYFRYFRIFQFDRNSNKHDYLALSGMEIYGKLRSSFAPINGNGRVLSQSASVPVVNPPAAISAPFPIAQPVSIPLPPSSSVPLLPPRSHSNSASMNFSSPFESPIGPNGELIGWDSSCCGQFLQPLPPSYSIVKNNGSADKWQMVRSNIVFSEGIQHIVLRVIHDPPTTNTWKFIVGCIPSTLDCKGAKQWVGTQQSWGYIAGTGGKCHDKAVSLPYGSKFGVGDIISIVLNFPKQTIEFQKNFESQGVAFDNLSGPVYVAASLTATESALGIAFAAQNNGNPSAFPPSVPVLPSSYTPYFPTMQSFPTLQSPIPGSSPNSNSQNDISSAHSSVPNSISYSSSSVPSPMTSSSYSPSSVSLWDPSNRSPFIQINESFAINTGSSDKWQSVRSLQPFNGGKMGNGINEFTIEIVDSPKTPNSWQFIIGVVPASFTCGGSKQWVGAGESWGYIGGTGGKCFNQPKSLPYGKPFGAAGDKITVRMDFGKRTVEFIKNGEAMGVAFDNLVGPVFAAVSVTATGASARLIV